MQKAKLYIAIDSKDTLFLIKDSHPFFSDYSPLEEVNPKSVGKITEKLFPARIFEAKNSSAAYMVFSDNSARFLGARPGDPAVIALGF